MKLAKRLWNDELGQDLIEYALMAGFIAVAAGALLCLDIVPRLSEVVIRAGNALGISPAARR